MTELKWQDPPARRGGTGADYSVVIDKLKERPGKWALIADAWKTSAPPAAFRQNGCEATARRNAGSKTWSVYARFPAPASSAPAASPAKGAEKAKVQEAVRTGTALTPPPAAARQPKPPAAGSPASVRPANDMGLSKFLADRRARGAVDHPE